MLVVGEIDDNVDPSSTYQVVNALQKANKDFELVVIQEPIIPWANSMASTSATTSS